MNTHIDKYILRRPVYGPKCPYCQSLSVLVDSAAIYNGQSYGNAYVCENYPECDTYVGCHPDSANPVGTLANAQLREWRKKAHAIFDQIWMGGGKSRAAAYTELANRMNMKVSRCHIGMMNAAQCQKVIEIASDYMVNLQYNKK